MKISCHEDGVRIDKFLALNTDYSRELISKMIKSGYVKVNENIVKPSYKVLINDVIDIDESFKVENDIEAEDIFFETLYEDEDLMVINKPSGLVVHPGNGNQNHTLVNALMYHNKNLSDLGGEERPGIVHRIDKDTSGIMLVAKNNKCHELLAEDFKNKKVRRTYIALLKGVFPHQSATIDAPIGRDKNNRLKMCVTAENSKKAVTHLKVIKRYKKYTLVSLILDTGRTHQIRVHMSYIGYPIYNDPVYSQGESTAFGQFLHSSEVDFIHPIKKEHLHFSAPLPKEFQDFIDTLEEKVS